MDCVSCRPVPLLGRPRPQEPRTASEKVKLCKFMVLRWRDWGARTRASALVSRNFVALPSRVLLMYCDSARSLKYALGVKFWADHTQRKTKTFATSTITLARYNQPEIRGRAADRDLRILLVIVVKKIK